jgi:hypothetical protein
MTAGVGVQDDFQSTTEERLTALEGDGQGQVAQANVNNLESGATSNFIPQNQQKVVKSVVDGNKPSDRGIQQMMSPFKKTNGENAIWDGPLSKEGFPMGKGSSSGISGMEVSKYPCNHTPETPITQKAKAYR